MYIIYIYIYISIYKSIYIKSNKVLEILLKKSVIFIFFNF